MSLFEKENVADLAPQPPSEPLRKPILNAVNLDLCVTNSDEALNGEGPYKVLAFGLSNGASTFPDPFDWKLPEASPPPVISITLRHTNGISKELELTVSEKQRLSELLIAPPSETFDCGALVQYLNELPVSSSTFSLKHFDFEELTPGTLPKDRDSIMLFNGEGDLPTRFQPTHFAFHLQQGLFLSKALMRPITIQTMSEMKKVFGGSRVLKLSPKRRLKL